MGRKKANPEPTEDEKSSLGRKSLTRMVNQQNIEASNYVPPSTTKMVSELEKKAMNELYPNDELMSVLNSSEDTAKQNTQCVHESDNEDSITSDDDSKTGHSPESAKLKTKPNGNSTIKKYPYTVNSGRERTSKKHSLFLRSEEPMQEEISKDSLFLYALNYKYVLLIIVIALLGNIILFMPFKFSLQTLKGMNATPKINISTIMDTMKKDFSEQPDFTFKIVKSAIRKVIEPNSKAPAIITLLTAQGAEDISIRFVKKLTELVSPSETALAISGMEFSREDPGIAKKNIDDTLNNNLQENVLQVVFVERLDYIPGEAALILHTFCDHENAPFKHAVYIMTVVSENTELQLLKPKEWDTILQEHMYKAWGDVGVDQVSSLLTRLTVSVAAIVPKNETLKI